MRGAARSRGAVRGHVVERVPRARHRQHRARAPRRRRAHALVPAEHRGAAMRASRPSPAIACPSICSSPPTRRSCSARPRSRRAPPSPRASRRSARGLAAVADERHAEGLYDDVPSATASCGRPRGSIGDGALAPELAAAAVVATRPRRHSRPRCSRRAPPAKPASGKQRDKALDEIRKTAKKRTTTGSLHRHARRSQRLKRALAAEALAALEAIVGSLAGSDEYGAAEALAYVPRARARCRRARRRLHVGVRRAPQAAVVAAGSARATASAPPPKSTRASCSPRRSETIATTRTSSSWRRSALRDATDRARLADLTRTALAVEFPTAPDWPLARPAIAASMVARSPEPRGAARRRRTPTTPAPPRSSTPTSRSAATRAASCSRSSATCPRRRGRAAPRASRRALPRRARTLRDRPRRHDRALRARVRLARRLPPAKASASRTRWPSAAASSTARLLARALEVLLAHPSGAVLRELVRSRSRSAIYDNLWNLGARDRRARTRRSPRPAHAPARRVLVPFGASARPDVASGRPFEISWARMPDLRALWPRLLEPAPPVIQGSLEDDVLGDLALLAKPTRR